MDVPHTLRYRGNQLYSSPSNVRDGLTFASSRGTLHWNELPEWQKDNEYILTGYRRTQNCWSGCFESIFAYLHNETINIHSHLWSAMLFVHFLINFYPKYFKPHPASTWMGAVTVGVYLVSAIFCLSASAFFHTSSCHSQGVARQCHALDYSGIVVLIVGSFYPVLYYGFVCKPFLRIFYFVAITVFGLGAATIVLNPEYAKPTHRGTRTGVFVALGLCGVVPASQLLTSHNIHQLINDLGIGWLIASGALYMGGALLYANRIPERLAPGRFDYFCASHQIFHVCVTLAALAHYKCVLTLLHYRLSQGLRCGN